MHVLPLPSLWAPALRPQTPPPPPQPHPQGCATSCPTGKLSALVETDSHSQAVRTPLPTPLSPPGLSPRLPLPIAAKGHSPVYTIPSWDPRPRRPSVLLLWAPPRCFGPWGLLFSPCRTLSLAPPRCYLTQRPTARWADRTMGPLPGPCLNLHPGHSLAVGGVDFPPLHLGHGHIPSSGQWTRLGSA